MIRPVSLLLLSMLGLVACGHASAPQADGHGHAEAHEESLVKGPHGGRLLQSGDFALEVTIFERGVPPEFRVYPSFKGKPLPPDQVRLSMTLSRINGLPSGKTDRQDFTPRNDYLLGSQEVYEPHSFAVKAVAQHAGRTHEWNYDSPEGRVRIAADMAQAQDLKTAIAGAGAIRETVSLYGSIQPDAERQRAVTARFPGIIRSVPVQAGDRVKAGQALATVESNESLQVYAVTAPIAGTVTRRNTNPGEATGSEALFEVADFASVWAELSVFPRDRGRLARDQAVEVSAADGTATGSGRIRYLSPVGAANQALLARVVLDNGAGQWTPGQFVNARVTVAEAPATTVVPLAALQTFRDWDVVFVVDGETYQAQPVQLGRRDASHAEILAGLAPGARIVVANSYLVKADIEKSGASHDH